MTALNTADHTIKTLERLTNYGRTGVNANRHQVTCSCGWTRNYVSHWTATVSHREHAQREATIQDLTEVIQFNLDKARELSNSPNPATARLGQSMFAIAAEWQRQRDQLTRLNQSSKAT